jgi:glycosyltransferase involved in cell wall biosynthesis
VANQPAKGSPAREITLVSAQSPRYYPHVARHLGSLRKIFPRVRLLYWEKDAKEPLYEYPGIEVERFVLPFGAGGPRFFLKLMFAFWRGLRRMRPGGIEAMDPYALVPARAYALFARPGGRPPRIVYFSMEYFAEMPSLRSRPWKRWAWLWLERWGAAGAAAAATVCDSIAERLSAGFGLPVATVRNVPSRIDGGAAAGRASEFAAEAAPLVNPEATPFAGLHSRCGLARQIPVLIYQGALQVGRGLEASIRALGLVPGLHLAIVGGGGLRPALEALARECGCGDRVHFLGELDFRDLVPLTRDALAGLALIEPLSASYRFALPGKLFEYIQTGVPVIATALPEMRKIIEGYGVGVCLEDYGPVPLAAVLRRLAEDKAWRAGFAGNLARAAAELCWEAEEAEYLRLYSPP